MCQLALNSLKNQKKEKSISDLLVMVLPERVTKIFYVPPPPFPLFFSDAPPPFKAVFLCPPPPPNSNSPPNLEKNERFPRRKLYLNNTFVRRWYPHLQHYWALQCCRQTAADRTSLQEWAQEWQMKFNLSKCHVLRISKKQNPVDSNYILMGKVLDRAWAIVLHSLECVPPMALIYFTGVELSE